MMSTPFGPLPPASQPTPPPATHPAPQAETEPQIASPSAPPQAAPGAPTGDQSIRSLAPTTAATQPRTDSDAIITDPQPMTLEDLARMESQEPRVTAESLLSFARETADSRDALPGLLLAVAVLAVVFVLMRRLRRRHAEQPFIPSPQDRIAAIHERANASANPIERAMSDAEELTRRMAATMENKAARLELLIEEADRKLEELNRAVAQVSRAAPVADRNGRAVRTIDPALLDRARVEQDRAERNGSHELTLSSGSNGSASTPASQPAPAISAVPNYPADPVHRRVWALADDGMPPLDIARSLNQPVGQVELILNLRKSG